MTHLDVSIYFANKYYELAKNYRIYTKCVKNVQFERLCTKSAIDCGLKGFQLKHVESIPEEDIQYFLSMGDHLVESMIILTKRNYEKEKERTRRNKMNDRKLNLESICKEITMIKCGRCEYFKKRDSRYGGCITCCTNGIISSPTEDDYCSKAVEKDEENEHKEDSK